MRDSTKEYLKQHIWNILQAFFGLCCLVLAGLEYQRSSSSAVQAIPAPSAGGPMIQRYSMPWYLWAGITALAFSVIVPAVVGMIRKRRAPRLLEEAIALEREEIQRLKASLYESARSNLEYRAERDKCEQEKRELQKQFDDMFTPLQMEAFTLAKDLRDFYASLAPFPSDPAQNPGEDNAEYLVRFHEVRTEEQGRWRQKVMHGYANRKFGERITTLMHRAGEEVDYPAYVPTFAEKPPMSEDEFRKLAQQMEMVAIWISRKQRNEVSLLK